MDIQTVQSTLFFYLNLSALLCSAVGLIFGLIQRLRKKQGTYFDIALMALATLTLGLFFRMIFTLCGGPVNGYSIGYLALVGCFLFFFTANRSYISVLEDAPTKHRRRATVIAALLPLLLIFALGVIVIKIGPSLSLIPPTMLCISTALCSYFSLKEVLLPDVRRGFIDCMRPFNILVCILALLSMGVELAYVCCVPLWLFLAMGIAGDLTILLLVIFLYKGVRKWRT